MMIGKTAGWFKRQRYPAYRQLESKDCGPTCLRNICKLYGKDIPMTELRRLSNTTREGTNLLNLSLGAEKLGLNADAYTTNFDFLVENDGKGIIIHWDENHFVTVNKVFEKKGKQSVLISDPKIGLIKLKKENFLKHWTGSENPLATGVALLLYPTSDFYKKTEKIEANKKSLLFAKYFKKHFFIFFQIGIGLLIGSFFSILIPLLTQGLVDHGLREKNINLIYLIFIGQFFIFIGASFMSIIRGWLTTYLSTAISFSLVSDFFDKILKLPINFFDSRITGDLLQRISDNERIQSIITISTVETIFSIVNGIIFSLILLKYRSGFLIIVVVFFIIYFGWVTLFFKRRKYIDYENFNISAKEQSNVLEMLNGLQEIKLNNAENHKKKAWEKIQVALYKQKLNILSVNQWQNIGSGTINSIRDLVLSYYSAKLVLNDEITIGMMLSIQLIIGQLNNPFSMAISFMQQLQDVNNSLDRVNEIYSQEEEDSGKVLVDKIDISNDIVFDKVDFRYPGAENKLFENLSFVIPKYKTTAIVGASGSGKTTILKLLLKYYSPDKGSIKLGNIDLENISSKLWRDCCGVVMQDSYLFSDSIVNNIAIGQDKIDYNKVKVACDIANISSFIKDLPYGYNTVIGNEGVGISGGQRQRIFIARATYKNPAFIFFDEATSSLDGNNEGQIVEKLNEFLKGKTAVIIAHRLSTVMNADQILVVDNGKIIEVGNHSSLLLKRGAYYSLIKNQLAKHER